MSTINVVLLWLAQGSWQEFTIGSKTPDTSTLHFGVVCGKRVVRVHVTFLAVKSLRTVRTTGQTVLCRCFVWC